MKGTLVGSNGDGALLRASFGNGLETLCKDMHTLSFKIFLIIG
jgi:hypothetical protein